MTKIIVLASYRTGSTALCNVLAETHNVKNYDEYFHFDKSIENYESVKNNGFVIKIMPDQIIEPYFNELISSATHVYGIYRNDVIYQIASYIVSAATNVWHNKNLSDTRESYKIDISNKMYHIAIERILKNNKMYNTIFKPLCHKEFVYEDIKSTLLSSSSICSVLKKPSNYDDLIDHLKSILPTYEIRDIL